MLAFNTLLGLLLVVILSLLLLIYTASLPRGSILGKVPGKIIYSDIVQQPENETIPGLLISRLNVPMFFANNEQMRRRIEELVDETDPKPRALLLADARDPVRDFLRRSKVEQIIGEEHFYAPMHEAVKAFQSQRVG